MLTKKQHDLLLFIHDRIQKTGVSPSFDEMKDALDLKSKSGIHRLIKALEERGFIRRIAHRARALEVTKLPGDVIPAAARPRKAAGFKPSVIEGDGRRLTPTSVPLVGRIAAGTPISALQEEGEHIDVPSDLMGGGTHYALEVKGDSMINVGINDGDIVIIQHADTAQSGDIVVALVDDEEATLKRLRKRGDTIALEAENDAYETRIYGANRVKVQGKLVSLMRRY